MTGVTASARAITTQYGVHAVCVITLTVARPARPSPQQSTARAIYESVVNKLTALEVSVAD
jgi:hypothetical protein